MKLLGSLLIQTLAVLISAYIIPGVSVESIWVALIVAIVLGILNLSLKPFLLLFTLPLNVLTLGLFTFVINVVLIYLVSALVAGFTVTGFLSALLFSLVLSIVSGFLNSLNK
jgi:putative membrane protein